MKFLKVAESDGTPVNINPEKILCVKRESDGKARVYLEGARPNNNGGGLAITLSIPFEVFMDLVEKA